MSTLRRKSKLALGVLARALAPRSAELPPRQWGLEVGEDGCLRLEGRDLHALLDRWGSPLHVVHEARLIARARAFAQAPQGLPPVEVYFSYKTNPVPSVLRVLHAQGVGAEVISPFELWLALKLGVPAERIVYGGPARSEGSLRRAAELGILVHLNSREEIARMSAIARALGRRVKVGLRISTERGWSSQFGEPLDTGAAMRAVDELRATKALELSALHAHAGHPIRAREALEAHVGQVLAFADAVRARHGLELEALDFGGSLAVPTVSEPSALRRRLSRAFLLDLPLPDPARTMTPRGYVEALSRRVHAHYRARGRASPRVLIEPGRALTGPAQMLLARVVATRSGEGALRYAILDAGTCLANPLLGQCHQLFPLTRFHERRRPYRVVGPICTPGDVLYPAWSLPELRPGDAVAIMDSGAYFVPFEAAFSFPRPAVVMVARGGERPVRRAERFEDMVARDLDDALRTEPASGVGGRRWMSAHGVNA